MAMNIVEVTISEIDRIRIMYIHWLLFSSGFSIKPSLSSESSPVFGGYEYSSNWKKNLNFFLIYPLYGLIQSENSLLNA
jgi:hypothetical protein